ncbi:hypothetical protein E2R25_29760 [Burkholderia pseudomallei]|nr:hypothetical protein E2R28_29695 [Burkholderia pseudomallei]QBP73428.1 hypothetical protein E2R25_29760 [Burkholderia pseudomallei]QBR28948.1 hypothetical protein E3O37_30035 [Burkholderia pseudomallei]
MRACHTRRSAAADPIPQRGASIQGRPTSATPLRAASWRAQRTHASHRLARPHGPCTHRVPARGSSPLRSPVVQHGFARRRRWPAHHRPTLRCSRAARRRDRRALARFPSLAGIAHSRPRGASCHPRERRAFDPRNRGSMPQPECAPP